MLQEGMFISDRYEIISKVGSGGMADVYKARCHRLNRFVAIKVLKPEFSDDKTFVAKFRAEAQAAAGLSHPNIVNVYDVGEDNGLYYIVMELVEGITLKNFIERKGKLEVKEAVGIAIQIAQGMEAAHDNHIIHRDIKPQNIIISREGKVKVTDFGIAKAATSNTITSNAMGSVHYISPEQARGGYSDEKSDIYSLGVTMYEMLSGQMPFAGDSTVSVALLHIREEAKPLRELEPTIPTSVERIVEKCMQKKPERRYLSAAELISDLKHAIMNPNGDFVKIPSQVVDDSPTILLSEEEVGAIQHASQRINPIENRKYREGESKREETEKDSALSHGEGKEKEEENESELDPKMEKIMLIGGIAAAIICAAVIFWLILYFFFPSKPKSPSKNPDQIVTDSGIDIEDETGSVSPDGAEIEPEDGEEQQPEEEPQKVPDLTGQKKEDATKLLDDLKISYRTEEKFSDIFDKDYVITQVPLKDTKIEKDTIVILTISKGAETFQVPDVVNRIESEARKILTDMKLNVVTDEEYHDEIEEGHVISSTPERGASVKKGDTITITLSKGPKQVYAEVPNLVSLSEEDAKQELSDRKLLGKSTAKHSDTVAKGLVIYQDTTAGTSVLEGTTIGYTVSLGPEEKNYKYIGTVTITANPFVDEMESGTIELELSQDGDLKTIYKGTLSYNDFPKTFEVEGLSESEGTIYMYVNDEIYQEQSWSITFKKQAVD